MIKGTEPRGVKLDGDDIIFDPERITPAPEIRGRVTAVWIEGDEVVQVFGGGKQSSERLLSTIEDPILCTFVEASCDSAN